MSSWKTSDFDYTLPASSIAQHPVERGRSRLLDVDAKDEARHRFVADLPGMLSTGDLLVVNDTRVIPARLFVRRKPGGGRIELLLLEKISPRTWVALAKPARRVALGTILDLDGILTAEVIEIGEAGRRHLRFSSEIEPQLDRLGHVPLPPYIQRSDEADDRASYQTIFAQRPGAVAAPTAGLHFSEDLLTELAASGVGRAAVTLHVGIGTFRPVTVDRVAEHRMESERYSISEETSQAIRRTRESGGRVVAVGTTVVRALESRAREDADITAGEGRTELFITPGFRFRVVDALLTNFHLPRSTLLMLVSAFSGHPGGRTRVLAAYGEAVRLGYRFYSYGDAMFLRRGDR